MKIGDPAATQLPPVGFLQGRLSASSRGALQAFPGDAWEEEFRRARSFGFDAIEWLLSAERADENPIRQADGRAGIRQVVAETGIHVLSVCAGYFSQHRFFRVTVAEQSDSVAVLMALIGEARAIGAATVRVPLFATSQIEGRHDLDELLACLREPLALARSVHVRIGLETGMPATENLDLIEKIHHESAGVYYATGHGAVRGDDIAVDIRRLGGCLCGVHVNHPKIDDHSVLFWRDRPDLLTFLEALSAVDYLGPVVL